MAEFKSSFIGGYSKKSVNEYVSKLENENDMQRSIIDGLIEKNKSLTSINDDLWKLFKQSKKTNHREIV